MPYVNGIHTSVTAAFEGIDAAIFSSDGLPNLPELRERITYFVQRWQRELDATSSVRLNEIESEIAVLQKKVEAIRVTCANNASRLDSHYDRLERFNRGLDALAVRLNSHEAAPGLHNTFG